VCCGNAPPLSPLIVEMFFSQTQVPGCDVALSTRSDRDVLVLAVDGTSESKQWRIQAWIP